MKKRDRNYQDQSNHSHTYCAWTMIEDGHQHWMTGYVTAEADKPGHVHYYIGITTCNDGHTHQFSGCTGPAISMPGGHFHIMPGETSKNDGHRHCYKTPTNGVDSCQR